MENNEKCISCGYIGPWRRLTRLPAIVFGKSASVLKCPNCGLGKTFPFPATQEMFYQDNPRYDDMFLKERDQYIVFAHQLLSILEPHGDMQSKKLLDIGCGSGAMVEVAGEIGYKAQGIDANKNVVTWCLGQGLDVIYGDIFREIESLQDTFDVIILSAVLEHIYDPESLLRALLPNIKDDSVIVVSQADFSGFLPRLFPWIWYGWQPVEHYWHFDVGSFSALAARAGYQVEYVRRNSLYHSWYLGSDLKQLIGRNVAALVARVGNFLGKGDSFDMVLRIK